MIGTGRTRQQKKCFALVFVQPHSYLDLQKINACLELINLGKQWPPPRPPFPEALHLAACVSTAFEAKALTLSCVSTAFEAKALLLPCVSSVALLSLRNWQRCLQQWVGLLLCSTAERLARVYYPAVGCRWWCHDCSLFSLWMIQRLFALSTSRTDEAVVFIILGHCFQSPFPPLHSGGSAVRSQTATASSSSSLALKAVNGQGKTAKRQWLVNERHRNGSKKGKVTCVPVQRTTAVTQAKASVLGTVAAAPQAKAPVSGVVAAESQ